MNLSVGPEAHELIQPKKLDHLIAIHTLGLNHGITLFLAGVDGTP